MSEKVSDRYLIRKIRALKTAAIYRRNKNKPGRRRYWMYGYLREVYDVFLEFERRDISKKAGRRIIRLFDLPINRKSHLIRVLIEATAGAEDDRTKIKWTKALRYAHGWRKGSQDIEQLFGENEGISGCANKQALNDGTARKKRPNISSSGKADALTAPNQT